MGEVILNESPKGGIGDVGQPDLDGSPAVEAYDAADLGALEDHDDVKSISWSL